MAWRVRVDRVDGMDGMDGMDGYGHDGPTQECAEENRQTSARPAEAGRPIRVAAGVGAANGRDEPAENATKTTDP